MRYYLIEDINKKDVQRFKDFLEREGYAGSIDDIYWFEVPGDLMTEIQQEHTSECGPHIFSLETSEDGWVKVELLARSRNNLRCQCIHYATAEQRSYIIDTVDGMLKNLDIPV